MYGHCTNHSFGSIFLLTKVVRATLLSLDLSGFPSCCKSDVCETEHTGTLHQKQLTIYLQFGVQLII